MTDQFRAALTADRRSATHRPQPQRITRICLTLLIGLIAAACASAAPRTATETHSATPPAPPCHSQYRNWRNGPVGAALRTVNAGLAAAHAAVLASDAASVPPAMRPLAPAALTMARNPMPRCADTRGIFANLVVGVYREAQQAHTAKTPAQVLNAARTLDAAALTIRQLTAEIIRALGAARCPAPRQTTRREPQLPAC